MRRFEGMRVVVAGCGQAVDGVEDIGGASATAFADEGAEVLFIQPTLAAGDEVAQAAVKAGGKISTLAADPRNSAETIAVVEAVSARWESLDILVTQNLDMYVGGIEATTLEQWEETLRVNLTSVFLLIKGLLPLLRKSDRAAIVNVGSIDGTLANANLPSYSASKGGVHALTHALAGELAASGIRVNSAAITASTKIPLNEQGFASINGATPLGRAGEPEEYAAAVLFLASAQASYITGVVLPVDGGRSAVTPGTAPGYKGYQRQG